MHSLAVVNPNRLLHALSRDSRARLAPYLEQVSLPVGSVLSEPGAGVRYMYFPVNCIIALINTTAGCGGTEVSVVGNEGVVGISLLLGSESCHRAVVQNAGTAIRLDSARIEGEIVRHADFMDLLLRYTQSLMSQISQTAICNRMHNIDQQLCRWLLDTHDRISGDSFEITHGLIANMLGVRREGVTGAAGKLQECGAIACHRGRIEILDRRLLERHSCECYAVVRREHQRLFPCMVEESAVCRDRSPSRCPTCSGFSRQTGRLGQVAARLPAGSRAA